MKKSILLFGLLLNLSLVYSQSGFALKAGSTISLINEEVGSLPEVNLTVFVEDDEYGMEAVGGYRYMLNDRVNYHQLMAGGGGYIKGFDNLLFVGRMNLLLEKSDHKEREQVYTSDSWVGDFEAMFEIRYRFWQFELSAYFASQTDCYWHGGGKLLFSLSL